MSIVVGFDFGTHQTKICVGNYSNPQNPIFSFWKFNTPKGETYTLPTIIQINNDDTLSYGYEDESTVKQLNLYSSPEPVRPTLVNPELVYTEPMPLRKAYPPKPKKPVIDWKDALLNLTQNKTDDYLKDWKKECEKIDLAYQVELNAWSKKQDSLRAQHEREIKRYQRVQEEYETEYRKWQEREKRAKEQAIFRYFKVASFSSTIKWDYTIDKDKLSVLYIANLLFDLNEIYGNEITIQMGFPAGAETYKSRKKHAIRLLLSAINLVEEVFHNDKKKFLSTPYYDLLDMIQIIQPTDELKQYYGLIALPEAFANLKTATEKGKISNGISLLVDIGGGTTDISMFCIEKTINVHSKPQIYGYNSVTRGINYVAESLGLDPKTWNKLNSEIAPQASRVFVNDILSEGVNSIVRQLYKAFADIDLPSENLNAAMKNRLIMYSGGGASYEFLRQKNKPFTDVRKMDSSIWSGFNIIDVDKVKDLSFVLSISLGLAVQVFDDEIRVANVHEIFDNCPKKADRDDGITQDNNYELARGCC